MNLVVSFFNRTGGKVGETPLHIASRIEEVRGEKCTKMLLKSGADTNLAMQDGRTPVHIASESGNIAVLKLLLANGADPLMTDKVRFGRLGNVLVNRRLNKHWCLLEWGNCSAQSRSALPFCCG